MAGQQINLLQLTIGAVFLVLLTGAFMLALVIRYKKEQSVFRKKIQEIQSDHAKNLVQTQLDIQEQTLQAVSRDIHDNIALGLTLSKLHLHTINYGETTPFQNKIGLSIHLIEEAIHNLSDISKSLNADVIRQYGLLKATETEIGRLQETGLYHIDFEVLGELVRMEPRKEIVLFRIVQETLNNIIKHAHADKIFIRFVFDDRQFEITIRDNGSGFPFHEQLPQKGAGLNNIRQRAMMIDSRCEIFSTIGKGSVVKITLPFQTINKKRTIPNG